MYAIMPDKSHLPHEQVRSGITTSGSLNAQVVPKGIKDDMIGKTISLARCCGRLTLQRLTSAHFSNLPWASDSEKWPNRSLAAGALQFVGRVPKRPRMLSARNSFPAVVLIASWNKTGNHDRETENN
jgi:hypothetical protein